MSKADFQSRQALARSIRAVREAIAMQVTTDFLAQHPDWVVRYGPNARHFGMEDASYHIDFLASAIEAGEEDTYRHYGRWAATVLASRGMEPTFLMTSLRQIREALSARLDGVDLAVVDVFVAAALDGCLQGGIEGAADPQDGAELLSSYVEALLRADRRSALALVLDAARSGSSVVDLYADVLQPAMYKIGRLWEENRITVAQEHIATLVTQFVMANLYPLIPAPPAPRGALVLTGVPGEYHQLGGNMVADALEAAGWDVRFLGTNTPVKTVIGLIEEHQASVLAISATMLFSIPEVVKLIDNCRSAFKGNVRTIVGGAAFRAAPSLYQEIRADACACDLRSAVSAVDELFAGAR